MHELTLLLLIIVGMLLEILMVLLIVIPRLVWFQVLVCFGQMVIFFDDNIIER